jgi:hypothetical protein
MSAKQHALMAYALYLLNKSRTVAKREPLWIREQQRDISAYVLAIMDSIEAKTLEDFEIEAHLWALAKTTQIRIHKIKDRAIWTEIGKLK